MLGTTLLVATDAGLAFVNNDTIVNNMGHGLEDYEVWDIHVSVSTIYAATSQGLAISLDNGQSFITKAQNSGIWIPAIDTVMVSGSSVYIMGEPGLLKYAPAP